MLIFKEAARFSAHVLGISVAFIWLFLNSGFAQEEKTTYLDPNAPVDSRVIDLLSRMSLEEKIGQMLSDWPRVKDDIDPLAGGARQLTWYRGSSSPGDIVTAVNEHQRLVMVGSPHHIPVMFHDECLHGAMVSPGTSFPQSIGLAATFNSDLVGSVAAAIASEEKALGTRLVLAPVLNLSRDPRWGRTEETFGESSRLSADLGVAYVKQFQNSGIATAIKHFVANYGDAGVDSAAVFIEPSELRNYWLRPFEAAIRKGGSMGVMASYNSVNGLPATANPWLLTKLLRNDWNFNGIVVSDYNGWKVEATHQVKLENLHDNTVENLKACFAAGLDVPLHDSSSARQKIVKAVKLGDFSKMLINEVAGRTLAVKLRLGLFEHPFENPLEAGKIVHNPAHISLARLAATQSITLLKNENGLLPLDLSHIKRIGVAGPAANKVLLGGYSRHNLPSDLSPLRGLQERFGASNIIYLVGKGEALSKPATNCDVIVYFGAVREGEGCDRSRYDLPSNESEPGDSAQPASEGAIIIDRKRQVNTSGNEVQAIITLAQTGKPVILCLIAGSPVGLEPVISNLRAVLTCWYPGEQGGAAIAAILAGDSDPSGRLPITWPKHAGQIPIYHDPYPFGRSTIRYGDDDGKPMFPFGFGLSYTRFGISNLNLVTEEIHIGIPLRFSVDVANTGSRKGAEVVQVYLCQKGSSCVRPLKRLEAYQRVDLQPGEKRNVSFELTSENLGFYDAAGQWTVESGEYEIQVGASSEDLPLSSVFKVVK